MVEAITFIFRLKYRSGTQVINWRKFIKDSPPTIGDYKIWTQLAEANNSHHQGTPNAGSCHPPLCLPQATQQQKMIQAGEHQLQMAANNTTAMHQPHQRILLRLHQALCYV